MNAPIETEIQMIVVGGEAAKGLAAQLSDEWDVRLLSDSQPVVERAAGEPFEARRVEYTGEDLGRYSGSADIAIVLAERDREGLLVTQLLNVVSDVDRIFVMLSDPNHRVVFEDVDCEILETGSLLRPEVERVLASGEG